MTNDEQQRAYDLLIATAQEIERLTSECSLEDKQKRLFEVTEYEFNTLARAAYPGHRYIRIDINGAPVTVCNINIKVKK